MDIKTASNTETEALFRNLDKPSLVGLSYMLRHPDTWPEGFVWNYNRCEQCAMGLAHAMWRVPLTDIDTGASVMARTFAMPYGDANSIFMGKGSWIPTKTAMHTEGSLWWKKTITEVQKNPRAVTPEMVADQIDAYLATAE
jgi:hypothetical protein